MSDNSQTAAPAPAINYIFNIDLTIGGSLPCYQVISGDFHLPANTMPPRFNQGDTIKFQFLGRAVSNAVVYARPLEASEEPAPFQGGNWEYPIVNGSVITIGSRKGFWSFTVSGIYHAIITPSTQTNMPFLVDPEIIIGPGNM